MTERLAPVTLAPRTPYSDAPLVPVWRGWDTQPGGGSGTKRRGWRSYMEKFPRKLLPPSTSRLAMASNGRLLSNHEKVTPLSQDRSWGFFTREKSFPKPSRVLYQNRFKLHLFCCKNPGHFPFDKNCQFAKSINHHTVQKKTIASVQLLVKSVYLQDFSTKKIAGNLGRNKISLLIWNCVPFEQCRLLL